MDTHKLKFTQLERELFSYLCIHAGESFSQRDIARALLVSPTAVANSLEKLQLEELVICKKTKNINFISLNRNNTRAIQLKRVENLTQIYLSGLANYLEEAFAGATIILFGSYSKGEDVLTSDIDIAVIERKDKSVLLDRYEKILFRKININIYSSWKEIHTHLKNNILNGITIVGTIAL